MTDVLPLILLLLGALAVRDADHRPAQRRDRAGRLPAAPPRAAPGAADHRDRRLVHPAERRPDRSPARATARRRRSSRSSWQIPFGGAQISVLSIFIFVLVAGPDARPPGCSSAGRGSAGRCARPPRTARRPPLMGVDLNQTIALTFLHRRHARRGGRRRLGPALRLRPLRPRLQLRPEGVHRGRPRRHRQHHRRRRSAGSSSGSSRTSRRRWATRAGRSSSSSWS